MNFKKKFALLLVCSIIFISQFVMVEAFIKPNYPSNSTRNTISPVSSIQDIPITTFDNPKPEID